MKDSQLTAGEHRAPRLILFDCDGTLMDTHHHIVLVMQQAFVDCELAPPAASDLLPVIGMSLDLAVAGLMEGADTALQQRVALRYRELYHTMPAGYDLFDGVHATLEELKRRGYWLGVVTGKSHNGLLHVLEKFDLGRHFLVLRTADHCPSKPHPAMVQECMAEMGVGPAQTTVVGDAILDMRMARASGARAFGVSFGASEQALLEAAGAELVIHEFCELLGHFPPLQSA